MSRTAKITGWSLLFTGIFLLSLNFWDWGDVPQFTIYHFPDWLLYFGGLQLLFALAILLFIKYYWTEPTD